MDGSYIYNPDIWPPLITAVLMIVLAWYGLSRRKVPGARPFAVLCLSASLWAVGSLLEISAADFSAKVFWIKFQAVWQLPVATTLPYFALVYAGFGRWLTRRILLLLAILPLLTLLLVITNDYHHFVWTQFQMSGERVVQSFGVGNWVLIAYAYLLGLTNIGVLLWLALRHRHRGLPAAIMLFGQITAFGIYLLANIYPALLSTGERVLFVLGTMSLSYAFALFFFHFFDPIPLARVAVLDQMSEGMLVLDLQERIADVNPTATRMLGKIADELKGRAISEVLPLNSFPAQTDNTVIIQREITLGEGSDTRFYNISLTPLVDRNGEILGRLILLHDLTNQKRDQKQILEQQEVVATLQERERLAREIHDSVGQTLGYVSIQAQTARKWMQDGNNEKADSILRRLIEVAKDGHADVRESILNLKAGAGLEWSFVPTLKQYLESFSENYAIRTRLLLPEETGELAFSPVAQVQLLRVIQEAMTNARKHSRARTVKIEVEQDEKQVVVTIADDGCGFDVSKFDRNAGNHFGLVFMRERMAQIGGSLKIDSRPGSGTTIRIELPVNKRAEV